MTAPRADMLFLVLEECDVHAPIRSLVEAKRIAAERASSSPGTKFVVFASACDAMVEDPVIFTKHDDEIPF